MLPSTTPLGPHSARMPGRNPRRAGVFPEEAALFGGRRRPAFPLANGRFAPCLPSSNAMAFCGQRDRSLWNPFRPKRPQGRLRAERARVLDRRERRAKPGPEATWRAGPGRGRRREYPERKNVGDVPALAGIRLSSPLADDFEEEDGGGGGDVEGADLAGQRDG